MAAPNAPRLTLILIPGLLCDERVWASQRAALADLADVRVAEHGMVNTLPGLAENILEHAPERFAVAGHSMGGRVALEVFRAAPERVAGMALMDTGHHPFPPGAAGTREADGRFRMLAKARAEGMRAMAREWVQNMVHPVRLTDTALIDAVLDMFEAKTPELYAAQIHAMLNRPDGGPLLSQIKCPTLVLCGHEDSWAPAPRHHDMAATIRGSTLVDIPNCGHMSTLEQPEAVNEAMRAWLKAVIQAGNGNGAAGADSQRAGAAR
jgi:pimeloyl-ACP methyl ester carboxylesterase